MTTSRISESAAKSPTWEWLVGLAYAMRSGPEIVPGEPLAAGRAHCDATITQTPCAAIARPNPGVPANRDSLLPKLLTGEIDVPALEGIAEEVL